MPRSRSALSIAEVSELLGVPAPTLRSWERRYGFPSPPRTTGRHRRYSREEIESLRALRDEIARGRSARDAVRVVQARATHPDAPGREDVERFIDAAVAMQPRELARLLNMSMRKRGLEATIVELAFPALREIGIRWESGKCTVGHEHLATEQIEAWLYRQMPQYKKPNGMPVLLGCGPEDQHRVGLDAFAVLLLHRGWDVRVLGAMVPTGDLVDAVRHTEAGAVVITSHMKITRRAAVATLRELNHGSNAEVFYAGNAFITNPARRNVPGTYLGEDLRTAADEMSAQLHALAS